MSGGVDSSVAAARLVEAGHRVTGVTLRLWGGESDSGCCSVGDVEDARRVAAQLGIAHYVFNLSDDFTRDVVDPYVAAYSAGRTPNPCVECNRAIKFGKLLERAAVLGFDVLATGHHARVGRGPDGTWRLRRGADPAKDQSYVLAMLGPRELASVVFPIGVLTKPEVRAHAARLGLRTAAKPDSQDVCFVNRGQRVAFLDERLAPRGGAVLDTTGAVVARHDGVHAFTIGQRRGLGVASGERRYVVAIDAEAATVTLGRRHDLLRHEIPVTNLSFAAAAPAPGDILGVQTRAHGRAVRGWLTRGASGAGRLHLEEPIPRVAPGQTVALYDGDAVVGGGVAA